MSRRPPKNRGATARILGSLTLLRLAVQNLWDPVGVYNEVAKAGHLAWQALERWRNSHE